MFRRLGTVLLLSACAAAGPAGFVGSQRCADCHRQQWQRQRSSNHAGALRPILDSPLGSELLKQGSLRERSYRFEYSKTEGGVNVRVTGPGEEAAMLLEWAFGSGAQAYTAVGRTADGWVEHRISYYTGPGRLSLTPGHFGRTVITAPDALGILQQPMDLARCFACHATGAQTGSGAADVTLFELGVRCERCHGPGADHVAAAQARNLPKARKTILNSGTYTAEAAVFVCGQCHRTPPRELRQPAPELEDPLSVRFQPVGLIASRCFEASKKLSCTTCHDPHENARRNQPEHYVAACLSCHPGAAGKPIVACRRADRGNCLPCHMRQTSPAPHLTFTDHRIRVY